MDWKKFITSVAPMLGTALGGPMAGMAVKVLSGALLGRDDATEAEIATAITSGQLTGDQIVAVKLAEQNFAVRLRELDIDVLKINQAADDAVLLDIQNARARQVSTKDVMPQVIFFVLVLVYTLEIMLFVFGQIPDDDFIKALLTRAFSTVEIGLTGSIAYFIGSSRGSAKSGDAVRKIASEATVR